MIVFSNFEILFGYESDTAELFGIHIDSFTKTAGYCLIVLTYFSNSQSTNIDVRCADSLWKLFLSAFYQLHNEPKSHVTKYYIPLATYIFLLHLGHYYWKK